jgi:hypothetical protein
MKEEINMAFEIIIDLCAEFTHQFTVKIFHFSGFTPLWLLINNKATIRKTIFCSMMSIQLVVKSGFNFGKLTHF